MLRPHGRGASRQSATELPRPSDLTCRRDSLSAEDPADAAPAGNIWKRRERIRYARYSTSAARMHARGRERASSAERPPPQQQPPTSSCPRRPPRARAARRLGASAGSNALFGARVPLLLLADVVSTPATVRAAVRGRKRPSLGSSEGEGAYARGRLHSMIRIHAHPEPGMTRVKVKACQRARSPSAKLRWPASACGDDVAGSTPSSLSRGAVVCLRLSRTTPAPGTSLACDWRRRRRAFENRGGWGMRDAQWKTCAMKTGKILDWHRRRHWSHSQHGFPGNSDGGLSWMACCGMASVIRSPIRTTPMPSPSMPSSGSPITRLPYDILQEIFTDCLLRYPLHRRQPSTTTAPILLCHICSSWRMFALASPTLWTHLSYCFTIVEYIDTCNSRPRRLEFAERDFEFIRWWRTHQGQIAPFLSFDVDSEHLQRTDISQNFSKNSMAFLLEYLISAQYLDLDMFCWSLIKERLQVGDPIVFSNLNTVLIEHEGTENNPFFELQTLISPHAFPVRYLSLAELSRSTPPNNLAFLHHWSTLTHLSLHISISLDFWLSLFHAVPHLRWAYFDIATGTRPFGISADTPTPPQCTLLELTTLTVAVRGRHEPDSVFPLSSLFTALHLPALRTLALSPPGANAWEDHRALRELYTVLRSTPAVTTLALEDTTLSFDVRALPAHIPALPGVEPIWAHAPALAHLTLALPVASSRHRERRDAALALFVRHVFSAESGWLDLQNPGCPIRAVTLSNGGQFHRVCDSVMASVREHAAKAPNVAFGITSDSAGTAAVDMRKEWGSRM
ncbi:hypothetical protein BJ912DRAFT_1061569 [Pholiota molesta]|nr:hypothetical protein BJ912DRAFT_1061569 [Pholiota molesta]